MILITGGAGFVGSHLALTLAELLPDREVVALDNLHRRGSELNVPRLEEAGVRFVRADVRDRGELERFGEVEALVECSAEPSVMSGVDGDASYMFSTNVDGAFNCLELARRSGAFMLFLSTSRVYPLASLRALALEEAETRFELAERQPVAGASERGVSEAMPLTGARTLYGTTKLAAELLIEEYRESHGVRAVVDRCGVIAGPWQMGKVDQGVFTHWLLAHHLGRPLTYIGYGGQGKQVRDLLHVADLGELVAEQLREPERWDGRVVNVGGGRECSLSLLETTELCRELTGNEVPITSEPEVRAGDVPLYISDCSRLFELTAWRPRRSAREVLADTSEWIAQNLDRLQQTLERSPPARG